MSKQNRLQMTNKTDYMTQADHEALDQELEKIDMDNIIHTLAYDYKEAHGNGLEYQALKQLLNDLLMFGEGEGVLVATAIKQLWEVNQEYKEEN